MEIYHQFDVATGPPITYSYEGKWYAHYNFCVPYRVLDDHTHIFIHIPKTGGTSLLYFPLDKQKKPFTLGHVYARHYPPQYRSKLFTIVRNPYSRLVSAYMFMYRGGFNHNEDYKHLVTTFPTFESWVLYGLEEHTLLYDPKSVITELTVPQHEFLWDGSGERFVIPRQHILRFENYAQELEKYLHVPARNQVHYNSSFLKGTKDSWKSYYLNKDVQNKVYRLYQTDFLLFGYNYEIE